MYRIPIRLMIHDIWSYLRRKKWMLIIYLIGIILILRKVVQVILILGEGKIDFLMGKSGIVWIAVVAIILSWPLMNGIPLRICQGIYVCPVNVRGKVKYLKGVLGIKIGLGIAMIFIMEFAFQEILDLRENWVFLLETIGLSFFTLMSISLNVGIGERGMRQTNEQGYVIQSRTETIIKSYWMCGLILQWIFLLVTTLEISILSEWILIGICLIIFGINFVVVFRYVGKFLGEILRYEDVYCQKPKGDEVVYDI